MWQGIEQIDVLGCDSMDSGKSIHECTGIPKYP
jgi:hypothetical protein